MNVGSKRDMDVDRLTKALDTISAGALTKLTITPLAGASFSRVYRLTGARQSWFVKCLSVDQLSCLRAEADGLAAIAQTKRIAVPAVSVIDTYEDWALLVTEFVDMVPLTSATQEVSLAKSLAQMHCAQLTPAPDYFGWPTDNYLGSSRQINRKTNNWAEFFYVCRIAPQAKWLTQKYGSEAWLPAGVRAEQLAVVVKRLLSGHTPKPALVHGDLWSGNWAVRAEDRQPIVYDPAVYFGDFETDLAMMALFGGLSQEFYSSYHYYHPLPPGWPARRQLYQLYHLLNHGNLFGGHYLAAIRQSLTEILF